MMIFSLASCSLLKHKSIANMTPKMTSPVTVANRIICLDSMKWMLILWELFKDYEKYECRTLKQVSFALFNCLNVCVYFGDFAL